MLISTQKFDDPRLVKYLILWAQVMGIGYLKFKTFLFIVKSCG